MNHDNSNLTLPPEYVAADSSGKDLLFKYLKWEPTIRHTIAECLYYFDYNLTAAKNESAGGHMANHVPDAVMDDFDGIAVHIAQHYIHPDDREEYLKDYNRKALIKKFRQGEPELLFLHRRLMENGDYQWYNRSIQLFADPSNNDIHCMVMIRKVTDTLARLQDELRAGAHELISASIPGGIIGVFNKPRYPIYYINDHMLKFLGYGPEEFRLATHEEMAHIIHPDDYHRSGRAIALAIRRKEAFELQIRIIKKDGTYVWVIIRGKKNEGTEISSAMLMCHFTDISQMISLQDELQEAAATAAEASKMKTLFLANMSHEIRTPMNGIIGFIELAQEEPGLSNEVAQHLEKIKLSANGLLSIIDDILDITKIESGKTEFEHIAFELHDVFSHCENIGRMKAEEKGLNLFFYCEAVARRKLIGDPNKLTQILINLLDNAIKFTEQGFIKLEATLVDNSVTWQTELAKNMIEIRFVVKDSGIGMTKEQLTHIFAPFAQADQSTTRKYGGTGLGLTITHDLINLMGGSLSVDSALGVGSTFSFNLSFEAAEENLEEQPEKVSVPMKKPRFAGEVLVCEDNVINQQVVVEHLSRIGLSSIIAANGQIAVEMVTERLLKGKPFDIIFMDIHMPVMDGIEATHKLLSLGIGTPIIALTANAMKRDREGYLALGMSDYIAKPFYAQELWTCLLKYLTPISTHDEPARTAETIVTTGTAIDHKIGLSRAAGDKELYEQLKLNFYQENVGRYDEITAVIDAADSEAALRIIHSLKSNAGWLGATGLSQVAAELELTLIEGKACSGEQLLTLKDELDKVLAELSLLAGNPDMQTAAKEFISALSAHELLDVLNPLLKSGSADALTYLDDIGAVFSKIQPYCDKLMQQIKDYDFDKAIYTLEQIRERVDIIIADE